MRKLLILSCVLLIVLGMAGIIEASISGTIGTRFTITGSGFGTQKGTVYVEYEKTAGKTQKVYATVESWSDTAITCLWAKKLPPDDYQLFVKPKTKGTNPIPEGTFSIMNPIIEEVIPDTGKAGDKITMNGKFFTTKIPKVFLENPVSKARKSCKVLSSTMNQETGMSTLQFVVPKLDLNDYNQYDLILKNLIGEAYFPGRNPEAAIRRTMQSDLIQTTSTVNDQLRTNVRPDNAGTIIGPLGYIDMANECLALVQNCQDLALRSGSSQIQTPGNIKTLSTGNTWTWTGTVDGLNVTFTMSETATQSLDWSVTLDGTYGGLTYSNFKLASGSLYRDTLNGKLAWHYKLTIYPYPGDSIHYIFAEMWFFDDGSETGYVDFSGMGIGLNYYLSMYFKADGTIDIALWEGYKTSGFKIFALQINPDGTGSLSSWCPYDHNLAVNGTLTGFGQHGSICGYLTACGRPGDPPCVSW